ncbi:hypothetical protein JZ751_022322 [Albula glossodonta]|uniref:Torsin-1A C-terminal domain-containing protein n=1 Tax=Albula glossodonta TaxID=121402 RepID=A0A8T2MYJ3_9TELE|nr:hypothetical protein JZ751_022322 [Albula glossodonta]
MREIERCFHFDPLNHINFPSQRLEYDLRKRVFGQHAATDIVLRAVSQFMADPEPPKPLVLSFHGPTGTGKSLVAQLIARNIYRQGDRSSHVHVLTPTQHFPLNTQVEAYKVCNVLSLLDHYTHTEGACHRRAIFIFLSTVGGEALVQQTLALSKHVLMCTLAEMQARGLVPDMAAADELINDMPYAPQEGKFFSACGCKNVALRLSTGGRHAEPQQG